MLVALAREVERQGKYESAHRVLILIEQIYRHAGHSGVVSINPGRDAKGCLRPYRKTNHCPAILDPLELGDFLVDVMDWRRSLHMEVGLRITWHLFQRPLAIRTH
jgi:hypothetical protein